MQILIVVTLAMFHGTVYSQVVKSSAAMLEILHAGMKTPQPQHTSLQFFVEIHNSGWQTANDIKLEAYRCCLLHPAVSCIEVQVLGDWMGSLPPQNVGNLTLVYPTLYVFGLHGNCDINVTYAENSTGLSYSLPFESAMPTSKQWTPNVISSWWSGLSYCNSPDDDPLHDCAPVSCVSKYQGHLNFYNTSSHLCQKHVSCSSRNKQVYNPVLNMCENLTLDMKNIHIETNGYDAIDIDKPKPMFRFRCVHGHELENGQGCQCEEGWKSHGNVQERQHYEPSADLLVMCNSPSVPQQGIMRSGMVAVITLVVLSGVLIIIIVSLIFYSRKIERNIDKKDILEMENFHSAHKDNMRPSGIPRCGPTFYQCARVQIPNKPLLDGELELKIGDVLSELECTEISGMWRGTLEGINRHSGIFPISCAQFYKNREHLQIATGH